MLTPHPSMRGLIALHACVCMCRWFAPFFDRTSFGKEAATLVLGMMRCGRNGCGLAGCGLAGCGTTGVQTDGGVD